MTTFELPIRSGVRPRTTAPTRDKPFPHQQIDQRAPEHLQEGLFQRARQLGDVRVGPSLVSLPESRALHLGAGAVGGPQAAFQRGTEFAWRILEASWRWAYRGQTTPALDGE